MNPKKCPKCGENNPPEAVMCWACYTPLSGGAVAPPAAGGPPGPPVVEGDEKSKTSIQPWQMGLIGGALLLAVLVAVSSAMKGSSTEDSGDTGNATSSSTSGYDARGSGSSSNGLPIVSTVNPATAAGDPGIKVDDLPFTTISSPNARIRTEGVMAIVAKNPNQSAGQAAGMAKAARMKFATVRWGVLYIYVFSDPKAGQAFSDYQANRENRPLSQDDYLKLVSVWPYCVARYAFFQSGKEAVLNPSKSPNGWWFAR